MKLKGIDVSHHQGEIDWVKVRPQIDFAILSVGYGDNLPYQDDKQFKRNADECTRLGIPFGVYIYSYAKTVQQAKSEAEHVLRLIKGYKLDYPVYYDLEDEQTTGKLTNKEILTIAESFCDIIESKGYWVGIYANTNWFTNKLNGKTYDRWTKWIAQYNSTCTYKGTFDIWQYSSIGTVRGIRGNVDMNYSYKNFPSIISGRKKEKVAPKTGTAKVVVQVLNIRNRPSLSGKIVGTYKKGEEFYFDGVVENDGFVWVKYTSYSNNVRYVAIENKGINEKYANCY